MTEFQFGPSEQRKRQEAAQCVKKDLRLKIFSPGLTFTLTFSPRYVEEFYAPCRYIYGDSPAYRRLVEDNRAILKAVGVVMQHDPRMRQAYNQNSTFEVYK